MTRPMTRQPVAACTGLMALAGTAEADTVRVTIAEYSKGTGPYFEEAAAAFEKANPGIDIQIEVAPWDSLRRSSRPTFRPAQTRTCRLSATRWLLDYVQQGVAELARYRITDELRGRFIPTFLTPSVLDGKTYGLPVAASARAMYYNKDISRKPDTTRRPPPGTN